MKHLLRVKIYYEDTDCGGVVYYANYLRYFERARTELFEAQGMDLKKLMDEGIFFVVTEASLKYLSPGRYGDVFSVETSVDKIGAASIVFGHRVVRQATGEALVEGTVKIACVDRGMKPMKIRSEISELLKEYVQ